MNSTTVKARVRFVSIMENYSGQREIEMDLVSNPVEAVEMVLTSFEIPWKGKLEKSTRIFINKEYYDSFVNSGKLLVGGDLITFIPISGGG